MFLTSLNVYKWNPGSRGLSGSLSAIMYQKGRKEEKDGWKQEERKVGGRGGLVWEIKSLSCFQKDCNERS